MLDFCNQLNISVPSRNDIEFLSLLALSIFHIYFMAVKLPYDPLCSSVGWLVGRSVGLSIIISSFTSYVPIRALVYLLKIVQFCNYTKEELYYNCNRASFWRTESNYLYPTVRGEIKDSLNGQWNCIFDCVPLYTGKSKNVESKFYIVFQHLLFFGFFLEMWEEIKDSQYKQLLEEDKRLSIG